MSNTYRMKPVVLQAVQWKGHNHEEVFAFCPEAGKQTLRVRGHITIPTVDGKQMVQAGTWVLKDSEGNFYVRDAEHFEDMYEPTTMVICTRWKHPGIDEALILRGTPEETREQAVQNFDERPELLTCTLEEWCEDALARLREFQS